MSESREGRWYGRWLRLYPEEFRVAYGRGMEQTFRERLEEMRADSGRVAVFAFLVRELLSASLSALAQRAADAVSDTRYTLRTLRGKKAFALVTVSTLALGIGANTAVFCAVRGVLLRPLPYEAPGELMRVYEVAPEGWLMGFSPPNLVSFREQATSFTGLAAYSPASATLTGSGSPRRLETTKVTSGFFELLGIALHRGRDFRPQEDLAGVEPVVILSHGLWQAAYGGEPDIIGRSITLDGVPRTIIGIAPAAFRFGSHATELWMPHAFDERDMTLRGRHWLRIIARRQPSVTQEVAEQELEAISARLAETYPETNAGWGIRSLSLLDETVYGVRRPLLVMLGAVSLVLLIACVNVANLSLARAESRRREIAVRAALGAPRGRLMRLTLTESLVLATLGGAVGLSLAYGGVHLVTIVAADQLPRASEIRIDLLVLAFTATVTVMCGAIAGLVPAIHGVRQDLMSTVKDVTRRWPGAGHRIRVQSVFVIAEVALALVLVIGAGLLVNSLWRITRVDPGFDRRSLFVAAVSLPEATYGEASQRAAFFDELVSRVQQLPGVASAAATHVLPLTGSHTTTIRLADQPDEDWGSVERRHVTAGHFRTMGIPLRSGRVFELGDRVDAPEVVVVNEEFARRAFPDGPAVGKRIVWQGRSNLHDLEIVGVVGDVRAFGLKTSAEPTVYFHNAQIYPAQAMYLVARTSVPPTSVLPAVRAAVEVLDPGLPLQDVTTMDRLLTESFGSERFSTLLVSLFAALALVLGAVGIYGVLSYVVSQRTRELGIRVALGARRSGVVKLVLRHGMVLALVGVLLGTVAATALSRLLQRMLFEIGPGDPTTYVAMIVLILTVGFVACAVPALRAARADPIEILRQD
jgi:putative ABC transport system permease protein